MSEENGAIIVPVYYGNLGSRHSSYTSHQSRISYTSHGDLLSGMTKESRLRGRSRNSHAIVQQPTSASSYADTNHKGQHREYVRNSSRLFCKREIRDQIIRLNNFSIPPLPLCVQEMSQDYTDEAGKVIKGSNPFIEEPAQSNTVVDMKGNCGRSDWWLSKAITNLGIHFRCDGSEWHHRTGRRTPQSRQRARRWEKFSIFTRLS